MALFSWDFITADMTWNPIRVIFCCKKFFAFSCLITIFISLFLLHAFVLGFLCPKKSVNCVSKSLPQTTSLEEEVARKLHEESEDVMFTLHVMMTSWRRRGLIFSSSLWLIFNLSITSSLIRSCRMKAKNQFPSLLQSLESCSRMIIMMIICSNAFSMWMTWQVFIKSCRCLFVCHLLMFRWWNSVSYAWYPRKEFDSIFFLKAMSLRKLKHKFLEFYAISAAPFDGNFSWCCCHSWFGLCIE